MPFIWQTAVPLLFQANDLKPLEKGKTYELWVIPAER